jgi:hypothetical protein
MEEPNPITDYIEDPSPGPRPRVTTKFDLTRVDQARTWMVYAAFDGDEEKTSIAAKVPLAAVRSLAHDYNWPNKLRRLKSGAGESAAERVANRAVNYLQAQRMRDILERSMELLEDEEGLVRALVQIKLTREGDIDGVVVSPKAVLELTKALEVVQNMSYRALGDKLPALAEAVNGEPAGAAGRVQTVRDVIGVLTEMQMAVKPDALPDEEEVQAAVATVSRV